MRGSPAGESAVESAALDSDLDLTDGEDEDEDSSGLRHACACARQQNDGAGSRPTTRLRRASSYLQDNAVFYMYELLYKFTFVESFINASNAAQFSVVSTVDSGIGFVSSGK